MKKKLAELIRLRGVALGKIEALLSKAETEHRDLNETETTEHTKLIKEVEDYTPQMANLRKQIELRDEQDRLDREAAGLGARSVARSVTPIEERPVDFDVGEIVSKDEFRALQKYKITSLIRSIMAGRAPDGFEKEMQEEALLEARNAGCTIQGSHQIPLKVMQVCGNNRSYEAFETRALTATGSTTNAGDQGGLAIQTNVGSIIERFYAKLMIKTMGVTILDGLVGNLLFPRHLTDDEAIATAENATAPVSSSKLGSVVLQPRRVPVVLEVSRQFTMQTSPAIEAYLRNDLGYQSAKIIDQYCISGQGGNDQPFGILNTAGITLLYAGATVSYANGVPTFTFPGAGTNPSGASLSYVDAIQLEKAIAVLNADVGKIGTMTNPRVKAALKATPRVAPTSGSVFPDFVWEDDEINGYRAASTTQIPSTLTKNTATGLSAAIFGNFEDAIVGQWGGMDMLINPYTKDDQGIIRINAWSFFDFNIRRPQSFAVIADIIA
jgi:HK97 family phage major capsid protein